MGGDVHSLVVLSACNPLLCVVTDPFVFRNALFVPYRHQAGLVEKIMAENTSVSAVFCHVDVVRMGGGDGVGGWDGMGGGLGWEWVGIG